MAEPRGETLRQLVIQGQLIRRELRDVAERVERIEREVDALIDRLLGKDDG